MASAASALAAVCTFRSCDQGLAIDKSESHALPDTPPGSRDAVRHFSKRGPVPHGGAGSSAAARFQVDDPSSPPRAKTELGTFRAGNCDLAGARAFIAADAAGAPSRRVCASWLAIRSATVMDCR